MRAPDRKAKFGYRDAASPSYCRPIGSRDETRLIGQ